MFASLHISWYWETILLCLSHAVCLAFVLVRSNSQGLDVSEAEALSVFASLCVSQPQVDSLSCSPDAICFACVFV